MRVLDSHYLAERVSGDLRALAHDVELAAAGDPEAKLRLRNSLDQEFHTALRCICEIEQPQQAGDPYFEFSGNEPRDVQIRDTSRRTRLWKYERCGRN